MRHYNSRVLVTNVLHNIELRATNYGATVLNVYSKRSNARKIIAHIHVTCHISAAICRYIYNPVPLLT